MGVVVPLKLKIFRMNINLSQKDFIFSALEFQELDDNHFGHEQLCRYCSIVFCAVF
jgi:hypothetical protein